MNSNVVTKFIVRLRLSLNCHKSVQIENVVRHQKAIGLPQGSALDENGMRSIVLIDITPAGID